MKLAAQLATLWLVFLLSFSAGMAVIYFKVFPYQYVKNIEEFVEGDPGEETTTTKKLLSDANFRPERQIRKFDFKSLNHPLKALNIPGLRSRREQPLIYLSDAAPRGYRVILAGLDFDDTFWGAVLVGPDGEVVKTWKLSTAHLPVNTRPGHQKNLYGASILPDGSIIFLMQEPGGGIVKVDWCGRNVWALEGLYHHTVSPNDDGGFWTYEGRQSDFDHILALVDIETGKVRKRINMRAVRSANPDTHIFHLQSAPKKIPRGDATHGNDIEELPERLANKFPMFSPGDLLISFKTTNLIMVLDPTTLKVKWWRIGPWDRQHDPDWGEDGLITVYSNNARGVGENSNIIAIDPDTFESKNILAGEDYDFYSSLNGTHQRTPSGGVLVASSRQGRVFEVDSDGDIVFDFVNRYDGETSSTLHVGDAFFLSLDFFNESNLPTCDASNRDN
jgi:hypothetical protein